ncbi:hypothetical protein CEXT_390081 [Caerostris extrusa]|uniref:Uncharacterized protein n=1 Tax=Caerostris extrusa TaxID=172846 RepID=A0AAV4N1T2_CAEEX|nr:hypothetical protein CEXT_390081 [Caerostris extrusa]
MVKAMRVFLRNQVIPTLQQRACLDRTIFMQGGIPSHIAKLVMQLLKRGQTAHFAELKARITQHIKNETSLRHSCLLWNMVFPKNVHCADSVCFPIEYGVISEQHKLRNSHLRHFVADTTVRNALVQDDHWRLVTEPFADEKRARTRLSKYPVRQRNALLATAMGLVTATTNTLSSITIERVNPGWISLLLLFKGPSLHKF